MGTQQDSNEERPQFSRVVNGEDTKELRQDCAIWILNVLDAVSLSEDKTRNTLVSEILGLYAKKKLHEANLIQRLAGGNPQHAEGERRGG